MAQHCPECGFANDDGASYCQRCGAFLASGENRPAPPRRPIRSARRGSWRRWSSRRSSRAAPRSSSGPAAAAPGESFPIEGDRLTVGRRPDSDVFLDDVTVSRDHALIVRRGSDYYLDDCGSLNGTYVNRRRIDSHRLADGDELQIGKYKLAFLSR